MATSKHRAPTQVTIATPHEETPLHEFVERYWKLGTLAAVAVTAVILGRQYLSQQDTAADFASWDRLDQEVEFGGVFGGIQPPTPAVMAGLAVDLEGQVAGPWAKAIEVGSFLKDEEFDGARRALGELGSTWPDHVLAGAPLYPVGDGDAQTLQARLDARIQALEAWEAAHSGLFSNPPLPEGSPRVRIQTTRGDLVVGLYADEAPEHVENFLKHCREGFYDGTKFHRVVRDFMIQGGDPNTIEGEEDTWGQGGPGYKIEPEIGKLWHFKHALAAAKKGGETESSGSQFYITTADRHDLDGDYTVFGVLLEGGGVATEIETSPVIGERPQDPAVIETTEILAE